MSGFTPSVGLHLDIPDEDYHSQKDWLSSSGAKMLMPPSVPAHYQRWLTAPEVTRAAFDIGKVTHRLVLGQGADFEVVQKVTRDKQRVDAGDLITKSAQEHAAEIRAAGKVPILRDALTECQSMAEAVLANRVAAALFSNGHAEASAFWHDPETQVPCRARFDWLPEPVAGKRYIVPDFKTAADASPSEFARAGAKYRYHIQDQWYSDGIKALGIDDDPMFLFVIVEKGSHLVNILPWSPEVRKRASAMADRARRIYRECTDANDWPGYLRDGQIGDPMDTPAYVTYAEEDYIAS